MAAVRVAITLGVLATGALSTVAAQIELRRECRPAAGIVTLGDVAVIHSADAKEAAALAAADLFPSPAPGQHRFLRVRELQDLLILRGVTLSQHRLTGSSQVLIRAADNRTDAGPETLSPVMTKKAEREVSDAVARYLQQVAGGTQNLSVAVHLDDAQSRAVTKALGSISVRGGAHPWVGRQILEVTAGTGPKAERFTVEASVSQPLSVVVVTHSLSRGTVIGASDVRLEPGMPNESQGDCFHAVEDVVGSETTQAIADGAVLQKRAVHTPLLVHRGEVVTVYARTAGICVRTTARVREDGSLGDLVSVESMADRKAFIARVCGIRELEVFARAPQAESTASSSVPMPGAVR